jgi:hypothetical protein
VDNEGERLRERERERERVISSDRLENVINCPHAECGCQCRTDAT